MRSFIATGDCRHPSKYVSSRTVLKSGILCIVSCIDRAPKVAFDGVANFSVACFVRGVRHCLILRFGFGHRPVFQSTEPRYRTPSFDGCLLGFRLTKVNKKKRKKNFHGAGTRKNTQASNDARAFGGRVHQSARHASVVARRPERRGPRAEPMRHELTRGAASVLF